MTKTESGYLSAAELGEMLSVSAATCRNWIRLGKITPQKQFDGRPFFDKKYAKDLKKKLISGDNPALRSRRNKTYASGRNLYKSYVSDGSDAQKTVSALLEIIEKEKVQITEEQMKAVLADCARQLLDITGGEAAEFLLEDLLPDYRSIIDDEKAKLPFLFDRTYQYEQGEDVLGLIYISLKNMRSRKATGAYYTPVSVVKQLCGKLFEKHDPEGKTIYDPCCGSGNFLLQLPDSVVPEQIYANDLDPVSVCLTRINLAVRYGIRDREWLYAHVTNKDYLLDLSGRRYDFIIGNPPWGYAFTKTQVKKLKKRYKTAGTKPESFDVCTEKAIRDLTEGGILSFILPEAILSSRAHLEIRKEMVRKCRFEYLSYLGNAFHKVSCPSVILQAQLPGYEPHPFCEGMEVEEGALHFTIKTEREAAADYLNFLVTDEEYEVLRKIGDPAGKVYLKGQADFALGIVTGMNADNLSDEKAEGAEPVLLGTDVMKFNCRQATHYIRFDPERMQQSAPEHLYRAPEKLVYRFINKELIFAYDDLGRLTLNSCNILIPHIEGVKLKYVLAVLNSSAAQFYFEKRFHSVKVLRSHLEQIPIPLADEQTQEEIIRDVDLLLGMGDENPEMRGIRTRLDGKMTRLYGLCLDNYPKNMLGSR